MIDGSSVLKMRVLICLDDLEPQGRNITHLANLFGVAKSTISRIMEWCVQNNMVIRQERILTITSYGRKIAHEFDEKRKTFLEWLLSEGVPFPDAEQDASQFALYCSNKAQQVVRGLSHPGKLSDLFQDRCRLQGDEVCRQLPDGRYSITCMLLHTDNDYGYCPSDSENWFDHSGELVVHQGGGLVFLKGGASGSAKEYNIFYLSHRIFKQAGKEGGNFFFPADDFCFMNIGRKHLLQGWTRIRLKYPKEKEREEIFTIFF